MIEMLVDVSRNKVYDYSPGGAIKLIMDCLEGCTKEQAVKILTGEYRLTQLPDGTVETEETDPDFDLKEWADDTLESFDERGKNLLKDMEYIMSNIVSNDKVDVVEISYSSLFDWYFNQSTNKLIDDLEDSGKLILSIKSICNDSRRFLEDCHELFGALSYLKNDLGIDTSPDRVIRICSDVNRVIHELCTDSSEEVNHAFAKQQYMSAELDKYIREGKNIEQLREENVIHPVDITSYTDAGWLSPGGDYYGLKGAVANFLHIQIADLLQLTGRIPTVEDMKADAWMSQNGWVKIHHDEVYYDGYFQSKYGHPMIPLTDIQKEKITEYGKTHYKGVLKFGADKQECSMYKFQQMDEFAVRKLFDF